MIDTHTHLFHEKFDEDRDDAVARAVAAGVEEMLLPNIDADTLDDVLALVDAHPGHCRPMIGLHPTSVAADFGEHLARLEARLAERSWAAIGEIGTDLYWSDEFWDEQREAFARQCGWAMELDRPVSVHCRESIDETLALIEPLAARGLRGVLHCFTGTLEQAERAVAAGFYLGIGGVLTYKRNGELLAAVARVPREFLLVETDSPFLAPVPKRGRRNESAFLPHVVERLAEALGTSRAEAAALTTANARRLFG